MRSCRILFIVTVYRLSSSLTSTAGWPSGLRRQFKALVFGRGFESHFSQYFGETCDGTRLEGRSGPVVTSALIFAHTYHSKHTCQEGRVDVHHSWPTDYLQFPWLRRTCLSNADRMFGNLWYAVSTSLRGQQLLTHITHVLYKHTFLVYTTTAI